MLFAFILWISLESSSPIHGQTCSSKDNCRQLEFRPDHTFDGKRLKNYVIRTVDVMDGDFCETVCYMEPNCVSYNLKNEASVKGKYKCELNNSTFEGREDKLEKNSKYMYRGAKNACVKKPCENNATCQTGFTVKGYRCLCTAGFKGEHCTKVSSCKEIYDKKISRESKAYPLIVGSLSIDVYCHMTAGNGACGDGGWTLLMKIDGNKPTFHYDSSLWNNKETFNVAGGETGFDTQETKLPAYWNTPFSKICLATKIGEQLNFVVIDKRADSLHSLIADGQYRATSLGRKTWKELTGSQASLQYYCNKEGFNAISGDRSYSKARIGILGNNEDDCGTCDSRIGFGTGGHHDNSNTCGNYACCGGDNGGKSIKAMGYIFVQ